MTEQQAPRKRGCLRIFVSFFIAIIVIIVILGFIGTFYEQQAEQTFLEENPPAGQLVDIGERNIHLYCTGEGSPTIILDAGQGGWSIDFADIQADLSANNRVCSYDRAGYGWSDPADDDRTLADISFDLHTALQNADIDPPYVLIAYSFTGLSARQYYADYRDDLAGMVLIDPAHENDSELLSNDILAAQRSLIGTYSAFEMAANIGLVRILEAQEIAPYAPFISTDPVSPDLYYAGLANPDWWATSRKEFVTNVFSDLPTLPTEFDIPVTIIGLTNSIPDATYDTVNQARLEVLQTLAEGSTTGELLIFDDIAHEEIIRQTNLVTGIISDFVIALEIP